MPCEFCNLENVRLRQLETGQFVLWDYSGERPHSCPIPTIYCILCRKRMLQSKPCEHLIKYGYEAGMNEEFFHRLMRENYQRGDWANRRKNRKTIGTSGGNRRTKDTKCKKCSKDLNHFSTEQIAEHEAKHITEETKAKPQTRLFQFE